MMSSANVSEYPLGVGQFIRTATQPGGRWHRPCSVDRAQVPAHTWCLNTGQCDLGT